MGIRNQLYFYQFSLTLSCAWTDSCNCSLLDRNFTDSVTNELYFTIYNLTSNIKKSINLINGHVKFLKIDTKIKMLTKGLIHTYLLKQLSTLKISLVTHLKLAPRKPEYKFNRKYGYFFIRKLKLLQQSTKKVTFIGLNYIFNKTDFI